MTEIPISALVLTIVFAHVTGLFVGIFGVALYARWSLSQHSPHVLRVLFRELSTTVLLGIIHASTTERERRIATGDYK